MEKLPKGWAKCKVGDFLYLKNGYAFKSNDYQETGIPLIRISDIQQGYVTTLKSTCIDESNVKEEFFVEKGDVLVAMSGATTGKYGIFKEDDSALQNQRVGNLKPLVDNTVDRKFIYYLLGALKEEIEEKAYGGAQPNISSKLIEGIQTNLPPLPEQQRIVAKLDRLFASLENTKSRLDKIPALLKNFRQAVLTQAVTGKLTEGWRDGKELEEWKIEIAKDCCEKVQSGGTPKKDGFAEDGIPFLKVYNIVNNEISFEYRPQYATLEAHNGKIRKSIAYPGDVLMNIVGPPLNKIAIIPETFPEWNLNQAITLFRTKSYLINKFLYYFFCEGRSVNSLMNETRGMVGQINISLTQCRNFEVPIPPIEEQQEIVKCVESLFAKADAIEKQYEVLKQKIDVLPQALLAKAFKGELVEQLDTDGDAADLLKEIEKVKASLGKKSKGRKKKINSEVGMVAEPKAKYGK